MNVKDKVKEVWGRMPDGLRIVTIAAVAMMLFAAVASASDLAEGVDPRETLYTDEGYTVDIYPADTICLSVVEATKHITDRGGLPLTSTKGTVVGDDKPVQLHVFVFPNDTGQSWAKHTTEEDKVCLRTSVYKGVPS